ncbi:hypothetical protein ASD91_01505 [Pseudomonas sp. Root68]|nr:hypothetical protein ASD91_01505 [Pseudomonas sp. Root68]KRB65223.1 hypothetical protein ASD95_11630 [Pseudomonas sp. Root71]
MVGEGEENVKGKTSGNGLFLWRGSLLPLDCEAVPIPATLICLDDLVFWFATAAQSDGTVRRSDKLPRHSRQEG